MATDNDDGSIREGETIPEDEATEKGRLWNSMSAIDADLGRPSQFLPLRPSAKSKMSCKSSTISPKVRAHNRPDEWLSSGRTNTKRSWKPKIVLEDDKPDEDTFSEFTVESGHNSFQSSRSHESLPTIPGGQRKAINMKVPIVIQQKVPIVVQRKEWATPTTETPKLSLNSSSIHSILTEDSQSRISNARDFFDSPKSTNNKTVSLDSSICSISPSPQQKWAKNRQIAASSVQLDNAPDLDDNGVGSERDHASSKPGILDMAMDTMEASMTSFVIEDDLETTSTTKTAFNMWNSMSVINTTPSLDADAQRRVNRGSKVKWSFKDAEKKNKASAPVNENESDGSKSKPQERKLINEKTPQEKSPELEGSLTSFASNNSAEPAESTDNAMSRYSMSTSCIESNRPDEFLPLRPKYRAKKASAIQHKFVAHNRPDDWVGPYAGSKPPKRSWTAKKVVEVTDMMDADNSGDELEAVDVST